MRIILTPLFALLALCATSAFGQPYPNRPVKLVAGFAPGGAADFVARALQEPFSRSLGQPVVVENRPGAGSSIAAEYVAKAPADGYTILIASASSIVINPIISPRAGFEPRRDLAPIARVSNSPLVLAVNPAVPAKSVRELIELAKKNPGKLNYATSGNGSAPHLATVLFMRLAGVDLVHVPFKGGGPAVQSVLAGDTQVSFATAPSVLPLVQAGRLRALAVTTRERTPLVPGIPGMAEAGVPDYESSVWYGFFAPAGTPAEVLKKLFASTVDAVRAPKIGETLAREGTEAIGSASPADFSRFLERESEVWGRLVKEAGVKPE